MKVNKLTPGHNLRWQSSRMMLPEHVEALARHQKEQQKKDRPVWDEQQLEEFSRMLSKAMARKRQVTLTLFDPYENRIVTGRIEKMDPALRRLKLVTENESVWIPLDDIVDIQM